MNSSFPAENKRYNISAKYFLLPLHIKSTRRDRCFRTDETIKKEDGSLRTGSVHEDSCKKK